MPVKKEDEVQKAINITMLQKDRAQLVQQIQSVQGAITYIDLKIAELSKKDEPKE